MSQSTQKEEPAVWPCKDTSKHVNTIKEELLLPSNDRTLTSLELASPCKPPNQVSKRFRFSGESEKKVLNGTFSGEVPVALANEQVQLNNYQLKIEDQTNIGLLLCSALDTQDAYTALNYCLGLTLVSESVELPKILTELSKLGASSGSEFPKIAELIKKTYEQVCIADKAFKAMRACIDKVCNKDDKAKIAPESLALLENDLKKLKDQAEEAVMSVVQSASIFAQNNISNLESAVAELKPKAEKFKKDIEDTAGAAGKSAAEWHKKYAESVAAIALAHSDYSKTSSAKTGKESAYYFIDQSRANMISQKENLLKLFNPTNKNTSTDPPPPKPEKGK